MTVDKTTLQLALEQLDERWAEDKRLRAELHKQTVINKEFYDETDRLRAKLARVQSLIDSCSGSDIHPWDLQLALADE